MAYMECLGYVFDTFVKSFDCLAVALQSSSISLRSSRQNAGQTLTARLLLLHLLPNLLATQRWRGAFAPHLPRLTRHASRVTPACDASTLRSDVAFGGAFRGAFGRFWKRSAA